MNKNRVAHYSFSTRITLRKGHSFFYVYEHLYIGKKWLSFLYFVNVHSSIIFIVDHIFITANLSRD